MEPQSQNLDLRFFFETVLAGRWVVLGIAAFALSLGLAASYFQELRYQSWARIQIDPPPFLPKPGADVMAQNAYYWAFDKYFRTETEKLNSHRLREFFAARLKSKDPRLANTSLEALAGEFEAGFRVEPVEDTNLVTAYLVTVDAARSADWLNLYLDLYLEQNARQQEENVRQSRELLKRQLDEIKLLLESQSAPSEGSNSSAVGATAGDSELVFRYQTAYEDARRRRLDQEQRLRLIEPLLAPGADLSRVPLADVAPALKPVLDRAADVEAAMEKLRLEGKGTGHPMVETRQAELGRLRDQARVELQKAVDSIKQSLLTLQSAESEALLSLRRQQAERAANSRQQQALDRQARSRDAWSNSMAIVEDKLRNLNIMQGFVSNNITITERARPDQTPVYRRGVVFLMLVGLTGLIAGVGTVIVRELANPKVRSIDEIAVSFDVPSLGYLPRTTDFSLEGTRESYNVLRTEFLFRRETRQQRVVMITSSVPQEGKTTVVFNLAKALSAAGDRTVMVDFDLRKARLRTLTGGTDRNGDHCFSPVQDLKLRLDPVGDGYLHAIVPSVLPDNPPSILSQPEIRDLLEHLRSRYDWVLVDTPPVTSVTDPVILASVVDSVLFVIKHDFVDKRLVRSSLAALQKVNSNIAGAVLNDLDVRKAGYDRYRTYYRYYGSS